MSNTTNSSTPKSGTGTNTNSELGILSVTSSMTNSSMKLANQSLPSSTSLSVLGGSSHLQPGGLETSGRAPSSVTSLEDQLRVASLGNTSSSSHSPMNSAAAHTTPLGTKNNNKATILLVEGGAKTSPDLANASISSRGTAVPPGDDEAREVRGPPEIPSRGDDPLTPPPPKTIFLNTPSSSSSIPTKQQQQGSRTGKPSQYKLGKELGKGGFGKVFIAMDPSGSLVAIKEIELSGDRARCEALLDQLRVEIKTLKELNHKNMVKYITSEKPRENVFHIVMEFVPGGSILTLLQSFGPLSPPIVSRFTKDILECLAYCHGKKFVHRDVKCGNILVDVEGTAKLCDFGAAEAIVSSNEVHYSTMRRGTVFWMPPEGLNSGRVGPQTDIWCLGCTVMEMFTANPPWWHMGCHSNEDVKTFLTSGQEFEIDLLTAPDDAKRFMKRCLARLPDDRPTAEELLNDPFLNLGETMSFQHPGGSTGGRDSSFSGASAFATPDPLHPHHVSAAPAGPLGNSDSTHTQPPLAKADSSVSLASLRTQDFQYHESPPMALSDPGAKFSLTLRNTTATGGVRGDSRQSMGRQFNSVSPAMGSVASSVLVVGASSVTPGLGGAIGGRGSGGGGEMTPTVDLTEDIEPVPHHEPAIVHRMKRMKKALVDEAFSSYNELIDFQGGSQQATKLSAVDVNFILKQAIKLETGGPSALAAGSQSSGSGSGSGGHHHVQIQGLPSKSNSGGGAPVSKQQNQVVAAAAGMASIVDPEDDGKSSMATGLQQQNDRWGTTNDEEEEEEEYRLLFERKKKRQKETLILVLVVSLVLVLCAVLFGVAL